MLNQNRFCFLFLILFLTNDVFGTQISGPWLIKENAFICFKPEKDCKEKGTIPRGVQIEGTGKVTNEWMEINYLGKSWIQKNFVSRLFIEQGPMTKELDKGPVVAINFPFTYSNKKYNKLIIRKDTVSEFFAISAGNNIIFDYPPSKNKMQILSFRSFEFSGISDINSDGNDDFIIKEKYIWQSHKDDFHDLYILTIYISTKDAYERIELDASIKGILHLKNTEDIIFFDLDLSPFVVSDNSISLKFAILSKEKKKIIKRDSIKIFLKDIINGVSSS
ncbi:hypothetical protein HGB47_16870 [Leptospira yasudae]|uniref:hypothetical protein n=1 Tax=Leptospira yasudae TaxID=2202201 RepID=UPI001C4FB3FE|nr:hypothetical protein [Leptospira yasudae]MBW0435285.1 hypothetical protein [Leptospira yasudae]